MLHFSDQQLLGFLYGMEAITLASSRKHTGRFRSLLLPVRGQGVYAEILICDKARLHQSQHPLARCVAHVSLDHPRAKEKIPVGFSLQEAPHHTALLVLISGHIDTSSHNDRLFWAASCMATYGALRGGEFLFNASLMDRQRLLKKDISWHNNKSSILNVKLGATKTKFWRKDVTVRLHKSDSVSCAISALLDYLSRSTVPLSPDSFLFTLANGKPLDRPWMVQRTRAALRSLGIDDSNVRAASWRSGGVTSARAAGATESQMKAIGRWTSEAYTAYLLACPNDLKALSLSMASDLNELH